MNATELAPPSYYCPTCARPRGNEHHADECVCAGTYVDRVPDGLLPPAVHVPGGQAAALERCAAGRCSLGLVDVQRRSVLPLGDRGRMLDALRVVGPKVPADVEVELTDRGWRITAGPRGQMALGDAQPQRFTVERVACGCAPRVACTRAQCTKTRGRDGHCHGRSGMHAEHVEALLREVARTYRGRVTLPAVPRHPAEGAAR